MIVTVLLKKIGRNKLKQKDILFLSSHSEALVDST